MKHDDIIVNMRTARNMTGIMGFISLSLFYIIGFISSSSESMMADIRIVMAQTITIITGIILLNLCAWFHRLHKIDWYGKPHWNLIPLLMANILIYARYRFWECMRMVMERKNGCIIMSCHSG